MSDPSPLLLFGSGAVSSLGPCGASRLVATTGFATDRHRRRACIAIITFAMGGILTYAGLGTASAVFLFAGGISRFTYAIAAAAFAVVGFSTTVRSDVSCGRFESGKSPISLSAVGLLGSLSTLIVSPCCLSVLAFVAGTSTEPLRTAWLLSAFALGHEVPVLVAGASGAAVFHFLRRESFRQPLRVMRGALMLWIAGYYGLLA